MIFRPVVGTFYYRARVKLVRYCVAMQLARFNILCTYQFEPCFPYD